MFKKKEEKEDIKKPLWKEILDWVECIVIALLLAVTIKYFIFTPTLVQMSSMYPTIFSGERVFANRLFRTFKWQVNRGDIITFEEPIMDSDIYNRIQDGEIKAKYYERQGWDWFVNNFLEFGEKKSYIKRVIGIAGDHIVIEDGKVYLNDELLDESSYLPDETYTEIKNGGIKSDFVVPEGYIFAMGDNREGSSDCRVFGCVPVEKVEAKVEFRIWPLDRIGKIEKSTITKEEVDKYNAKQFHIGV